MGEKELRGGRKSRRDRFYRLENKPSFEEFRHWWHRKVKKGNGGRDIQNKQEADQFWDQWVSEGAESVKSGGRHE